MNTRNPFECWSSSFSNSGPAIVRAFVSEKDSFTMISDQMISVLSSPTFSAVSTPTKDLFDRIKDLKARYSGSWIPNSIVPKDSAYQDAKDFVLTLPLARMVKPAIHVASDGEVNFHWSGADYKIDLGFYGNEKFSFYAVKAGLEPILGDDIPVKNGIPENVIGLVSAV